MVLLKGPHLYLSELLPAGFVVKIGFSGCTCRTGDYRGGYLGECHYEHFIISSEITELLGVSYYES